ncbi:plasmid segregation protein ParR [Staphylococcus pseudintermedius]|uniref:Plasmid segregation protein ParR n=1 Tax=Staphylococcus schleiferi TaxID=1295 RepID=A0A0K0ME10_STASC|nr:MULTISPECIES: plasmid segregation protein ParR [Staphylococcus]AKB09688.1 plasmid segregation protein ParR [Staphylococcus schleiferi]EGQ1630764.1 plasmid segregation protein ParR [Staphylococcus pseudintermedius]EGQ2689207.1 plasmid segregation protein ParR [Staphylococcus pseudintermedius]EGQ3269349.1 plasmid segregation protein ParR [Staphylococcus pseudintermedius]EGQ4380923.1 plasmid segregation protein ParR [Staphylococcus pseudintermedius]
MDKKETKHLLKIKKEDYPQIFDFLENVPRGTKTAHIREALRRYIEEIGENPPIPSKEHTTPLKRRTEPIKRKKESYKDAIERMDQSKQAETPKIEEKDEEMVDISIDDL